MITFSSCVAVFLVLVWAADHSKATYLKTWDVREEGDLPRWDVAAKMPPFEQAMLQKLQQNYYDAEIGLPYAEGGNAVPSKRQIRYHQCYFNPISCFRKKK